MAQYKKTVKARIKAKNQKIRAQREQAKRDRTYWPPQPITERDLRVRGVNVEAFARLGICEAGRGSGAFGVRWNTPYGWTWQGGLGMYRGTHQSVGHPYERDIGQASWQTQMLVGHRVMLKYGITAWAAHRCYYG